MSDAIEMDGEVVEANRDSFWVKIDGQDHIVLCKISGKIRKHNIRILEGDQVRVEVSPYDIGRGRITYRNPPSR